MKKLGIIQPGKIGDVIICLPIAKYYYNQGYEIIWPIYSQIINNFIEYVDYVKFVPINRLNCLESYQVCYKNCNTILDLSFNIPGSSSLNTHYFTNMNTEFSFDELKYQIANVPFKEKWNLEILRDRKKEDNLFDKLVTFESYDLIQEQSSDRFIKIDNNNSVVKIIPIEGYSVFDWLKIVERANKHILIASSFLNLIDQLKIDNCHKCVVMKSGYDGKPLKDGHLRGFPRLNLDWEKINY
jgi:hypothetical protein